MQVSRLVISLLLFIVLIAGCSKDSPLQPPPPDAKLSTLSGIQSNVFTPSCTGSGCHAGASPAASLNLTTGSSYSQLVNQTSLKDATKERVEPNNSANSMLVLILRGSVSPRMPSGAAALSSATIDSIAKWIDDGALNN